MPCEKSTRNGFDTGSLFADGWLAKPDEIEKSVIECTPEGGGAILEGGGAKPEGGGATPEGGGATLEGGGGRLKAGGAGLVKSAMNAGMVPAVLLGMDPWSDKPELTDPVWSSKKKVGMFTTELLMGGAKSAPKNTPPPEVVELALGGVPRGSSTDDREMVGLAILSESSCTRGNKQYWLNYVQGTCLYTLHISISGYMNTLHEHTCMLVQHAT